MNPLMSCGARLPVYALFGAAFFGAAAGASCASAAVAVRSIAATTAELRKRLLFLFISDLPITITIRISSFQFQAPNNDLQATVLRLSAVKSPKLPRKSQLAQAMPWRAITSRKSAYQAARMASGAKAMAPNSPQ